MTKFIDIQVGNKTIGHIWKDGHAWSAEHVDTGLSWDMIDTKRDAIDLLLDNEMQPETILSKQDYKEALNAAMLYTQSAVYDINHGATLPSDRSKRLLRELADKHGDTIRAVAAELNNPPK